LVSNCHIANGNGGTACAACNGCSNFREFRVKFRRLHGRFCSFDFCDSLGERRGALFSFLSRRRAFGDKDLGALILLAS